MLDEDAPPAKAAPKKEPKKVEPVKKTESKPQSSRREDRGDRGDRGDSRGDRGGRGRRDGGRGRGRGRGRGGNGNRREFDRHESGTGRDRGAKKDGAGKYNWGKEGEQDEDRPRRRFDRDDKPRGNRFNDESGESKPAEEGTEAAADGEAADGAETAEAKPEDETPPEPEVFSYEEYLAKKAENAVADDLEKKLRTVDNDESQWKSSAVKAADNKQEESDYQLGTAKSGPKRGKKGKAKKTALSLDEFAKAPGGGQQRGRGRGRGRGNGGGRGNRGGNFNLRNDEFPTLGGK